VLVVVILASVAAAPAIAQEEVRSEAFNVEYVQGCVKLKYPDGDMEAKSYEDVHQLAGGQPAGGRGMLGSVQAIANSISQSRDGQFHSVDELKQYYKPGDGNTLRRTFTIGRQASFTLCVRPRLDMKDGPTVTYETRVTDLDISVRSKDTGAVNSYITNETAQKIDAENRAFQQRAEKAIEALQAQVKAQRDPLSGNELTALFTTTGVPKDVKISFGGVSRVTTVKLRRPQADSR
jgi:hypothetical protein